LSRSVAVHSDRLASIIDRACHMAKFDERTIANMDVVLEEACRDLPNGGDHKSRKYIAKKLMQSVKKGNVTLEGLRPVARRALSELSSRKSG
jgi:hypothetical protein